MRFPVNFRKFLVTPFCRTASFEQQLRKKVLALCAMFLSTSWYYKWYMNGIFCLTFSGLENFKNYIFKITKFLQTSNSNN